MLIKFTCRCGHVMQADQQHAGRKANCPKCGIAVLIPISGQSDTRRYARPIPAPGGGHFAAAEGGSGPTTAPLRATPVSAAPVPVTVARPLPAPGPPKVIVEPPQPTPENALPPSTDPLDFLQRLSRAPVHEPVLPGSAAKNHDEAFDEISPGIRTSGRDGIRHRTSRGAQDKMSWTEGAVACLVLLVLGGGTMIAVVFVRNTLDASGASARFELGPQYSDPNGRYTCRVPNGWRVVEEPKKGRSNVRFEMGRVHIRVATGDTARHRLDERSTREMSKAMQDIVDQVRRAGGQGRILGVSHESILGFEAVRTELQIDSPSYLWVRQITFVHNGTQHVIGLHVGSHRNRNASEKLFDEFLRSYSVGKQSM